MSATMPPRPPSRADAPAGSPEPPDDDARKQDKIQRTAEIVEVLRDSVNELETKYLRIAHQLGRGMTGRAGSFDEVPEFDDMVRAKANLDHMTDALTTAERAHARLLDGRTEGGT